MCLSGRTDFNIWIRNPMIKGAVLNFLTCWMKEKIIKTIFCHRKTAGEDKNREALFIHVKETSGRLNKALR